jgi:hypothetical protein
VKIQVQFDCPIGVVVDTDTGEIDSVHVWDDSVDFTAPTKAYRNEYLRADHPEFQRALEVQREDLRERLGWSEERLDESERLSDRTGVSLFEEMPLDHPAVTRVRQVIAANDGPMWPGWEFGP